MKVCTAAGDLEYYPLAQTWERWAFKLPHKDQGRLTDPARHRSKVGLRGEWPVPTRTDLYSGPAYNSGVSACCAPSIVDGAIYGAPAANDNTGTRNKKPFAFQILAKNPTDD